MFVFAWKHIIHIKEDDDVLYSFKPHDSMKDKFCSFKKKVMRLIIISNRLAKFLHFLTPFFY